MCNIDYRIKKVKAYVNRMASAYIVACSKLAMLRPLVYNNEFRKRFNNRIAADGLERLEITLLLDLIEDLVGMTLDKDERSASLFTVTNLIKEPKLKSALKEVFCKIGSQKRADLKEKDDEFEKRYTNIMEGTEKLIKGEIGKKLKLVRNKIASHYEMNRGGGEPIPFEIQDFDLKWGDEQNYMNEAEPIIFDAAYLINRDYYSIDEFKRHYDNISNYFWGIKHTNC